MGNDVRDRGVAVFGKGIDALLHAYYLQRFGFTADVYISDSDFPKETPSALVSTWIGLHQTAEAIEIARRGIAELRDIALDLRGAVIAAHAGTLIYERRPERVLALEQFAIACRSKGLLVDFLAKAAHLDLPPYTVAAIRFSQDVSVCPRAFSRLLIDSVQRSGGNVYSRRPFSDMRSVGNLHQMHFHSETLSYRAVVLDDDRGQLSAGRPSEECADESMGITGRYLSFEGASRLIEEAKASNSSRFFSLIFDPVKGFLSGKAAAPARSRLKDWPVILPLAGRPNVFCVEAPVSLAHLVASARALPDFMCHYLKPSSHPEEETKLFKTKPPQSIPWII